MTPALDLATKILKLIVLGLLAMALGLLLPEERDTRNIVRDTHVALDRMNRLLLEADLTSMYVRKASVAQIKTMQDLSSQLNVLAKTGVSTEEQATATLAQLQATTAALQKSAAGTLDAATEATRGIAPAETELASVLQQSKVTLVAATDTVNTLNATVSGAPLQNTLQNVAAATSNAAEVTAAAAATMKDIQEQVHDLPKNRPFWWRLLHWF